MSGRNRDILNRLEQQRDSVIGTTHDIDLMRAIMDACFLIERLLIVIDPQPRMLTCQPCHGIGRTDTDHGIVMCKECIGIGRVLNPHPDAEW